MSGHLRHDKDLEKEVKAGRFREDPLLPALGGARFLPPLRKRKEDIETIAGRLLAGISAEIGKRSGPIAEGRRCAQGYSWPGNVRNSGTCSARRRAFGQRRIDAKDLFLLQGKKTAPSTA